MNTGMKRANDVAGEIYSRFMQEVLEKHVLKERAGSPLGEELKKNIQSGKSIDPRVIYLMSISGKGGWDDDAGKRERYLKNQNVTLLDHLLSVVRGALMLAALDWLLENPDMDERELRQRLIVIAAIAFLHDLDKMLQLLRDAELTVAHVDEAVKRYGITAFLASEGVELSHDQIRFLIEQAEDSQRYRHPAAVSPPRAYKHSVERYIKLADKLDGLWQEHGAQGGLEAIIQRLQQEQSFSSALLAQWETVDVFDPHHPFLLDELQRRLSFACQRIAGIPPLLEVHQDGRLFMLLPKAQSVVIKEKGLTNLLKNLPFGLEIQVSTELGIPKITNMAASYEEIKDHLRNKTSADTLSALFLIKSDLKDIVTQPLHELLNKYGLSPRWIKTDAKQVSIYPSSEILGFTSQEMLMDAAMLALLLNVSIDDKKHSINEVDREDLLLNNVGCSCPEWISMINGKKEHLRSRRTLISLWLVALSQNDSDLKIKIWGENGILNQWLKGGEKYIGLSYCFKNEKDRFSRDVQNYLLNLLGHRAITEEDNGVSPRYCLFTGIPVKNVKIKQDDKLYGINISAFSGRDNRPERLDLSSPDVNISSISHTEYKLRTYSFGGGLKKPNEADASLLISSPSTTGLFAGLILNNEQSIVNYSLFFLLNNNKSFDVYKQFDAYRYRCRIAKYESMPDKLYAKKNKSDAGQIVSLKNLLSAALRIGRPIHVFRGLPTPQKAFFYFDAMPPVLRALIGYQALRLEQIPDAIANLNMAQILVSTPGLGYDVLNLYAFPRTRFSAICLAWCHAHDALKHPNNQKTGAMKQLAARLFNEFQQLEEQQNMSDSDGALVRLGQAATRIQQRPYVQASTSEEMLVFKICLDSALALRIDSIMNFQT